MTQWYRYGDFYQPINPSRLTEKHNEPVVIRQVDFKSIESPIIKEVSVKLYTDGVIRIYIHPTHRYEQKLYAAAYDIIPEDSFDDLPNRFDLSIDQFANPDKEINPWSIIGTDVRIKIAGNTNKALMPESILDKIVELLRYINRDCERTIFPKELIDEISQIVEFVYHGNTRCQHLMSDQLVTHSHTHPARKNSKELIRILSKLSSLTADDKKECRYLLSQGENPDQVEPGGMQAILLAIIRHKSNELTNAFMFFGASIFRRSHETMYFESPYDLTLRLYLETKNTVYLDMLNMMGGLLTRLERQISKSATGVKVVNSLICHNGNSITTTFKMSDGVTIVSDFKHASAVTIDKKQEILNSVEKTFNKENVQHYLRQNVFIDSIYNGKKLIGFNLFEIIMPDDKNDKDFILHVVYSYMNKQYQGYGVMRILEFRLGYAMQSLLKNHNVIVFYSACSRPGQKQAEDFLYAPRHQPPDMDKTEHKILNKVFQGNYHYYHDGTICYVLDEDQIKSGGFTGSKTDVTHQYVFEHIVGGVAVDASGMTRGIPIYFYIGDENYIKECQLAEKIGVNYTSHFLQLSNAMRCLVNPHVNYAFKNQTDLARVLREANILFWKCPPVLPARRNEPAASAKANL